MSKLICVIDAKSFIIGVLSAVVVVMAMGAQRVKPERAEVRWLPLDPKGLHFNVPGTPFAVGDGMVYYYS